MRIIGPKLTLLEALSYRHGKDVKIGPAGVAPALFQFCNLLFVEPNKTHGLAQNEWALN